MSAIALRAATPADADAIHAVADVTWRATYAGIFPAEFIDRFLAEVYQPARLANQIDLAAGDPLSRFDVAEEDGRVVGFIHMQRDDGSPRVFRLYILPTCQRHGIGAALLERIEIHLRRHGERSYWLRVHRDNEIGKAFYIKHGFVHRAERDVEGEWSMEKVL
jgi:ribosomal protein S18 acetylase RimI-like enzyme